MGDVSLAHLRAQSRSDVLDLLTEGLRDLDRGGQLLSAADAEALRPLATSPFFLTGHQPELFHPGVWFKNFLIDCWARAHIGLAINILVDHDQCRSLTIRVPCRDSHGRLKFASIEPEERSRQAPWEWTYPNNVASWRGFPERVHAAMAGVGAPHLLAAIWPDCMQALEAGLPVGRAFSIGRNAIERSSGLRVHDVPMSELCRRRGFATFARMLMADRVRLADCYNRARAEYRAFFKIRNEAHPVPPLNVHGEWVEVPLRIYRRDDPIRRPVFVSAASGRFRISDGQKEVGSFPDTTNEYFWDAWMHWADQGWCIRPRALSMTLFLRLFVSDHFVHGIGGGLYDQMTNQIIKTWLGIEAPVYAVATATMKLNMPSMMEQFESSAALTAMIRSTLFHAERFRSSILPEDQTRFAEAVSKKQALLNDIPPRGEKRNWHREISTVNRSLASLLAHYRSDLEKNRSHSQMLEREWAIQSSREHPYVLFKESILGELKALADESYS